MYNAYRPKTKFTQFGNLLIILGVIPIATFVLAFIVILIGFTGFFTQLLSDVVLSIVLIILLVNNKNIKDTIRTPEFSSYYVLIAIYAVGIIVSNLFYYITYFLVWDEFNWLICLIVYDGIILMSSIFELIAWIRLSKYGLTMISPFGGNIKIGAILLTVGAALSASSILIDLSSLIITSEILSVLILVIGLATSIIYIIGYFKTGNNFRRLTLFSRAPEPVLDSANSMYIPPPSIQENQPPSRSDEIKFCIKCGTNLIPDGEFCPRCGWKIEKYI